MGQPCRERDLWEEGQGLKKQHYTTLWRLGRPGVALWIIGSAQSGDSVEVLSVWSVPSHI